MGELSSLAQPQRDPEGMVLAAARTCLGPGVLKTSQDLPLPTRSSSEVQEVPTREGICFKSRRHQVPAYMGLEANASAPSREASPQGNKDMDGHSPRTPRPDGVIPAQPQRRAAGPASLVGSLRPEALFWGVLKFPNTTVLVP